MRQKFKFLLTGMFFFYAFNTKAQITTSAIDGTLIDEQKTPVIGVTIQAVHTASGTTYGAISDLDGRFHIRGMRSGGPYTITISYIGYEPCVYQNVYLKLGESAEFNTQLKESAQLMEEVVVTAKAGINGSRTGAGTNIDLRNIQRMPSVSHSIGDVLRNNPQVNVSTNGAISFAGMSNRYNSFQIDGAMNNDNFGLTNNGSNGGIAGTQPMSLETIEQVQVNIAPFDVRLSGFTGGAINAITKSGTNEFHGSLYGFGNNQDLVGKHYGLRNGTSSGTYTKQSELIGGVTLGGPIIKNKLFFFANYEKVSKSTPYAYGIGTSASKADANVAREVMEFIKQKAQEQGVTYNGNFLDTDIETQSDKASIKLDWNINDRHKAIVRWSMVSAKQLNNTGNASNLHTTDFAYNYTSKTQTVIAELQSRLSNNITNGARLSYVGVRDKRNPGGSSFPMIQVKQVGDATLNLGNERSSMINNLNQDIWTLTDNLNFFAGRHTITVGTHNELYKFTNLFIQDYYGSYYFESPQDLYDEKINRFRFSSTMPSGNPLWKPTFSALLLALYAQDKYTVTDNLTLTLGLRFDTPVFLDTPEENKAFNDYSAEKGWGLKTNQNAKSTPMVSPRFGFRWKLNQGLLRGGAGVFTGRIPFVWLSNNFSMTGSTMNNYSTYACSSLKFHLNPSQEVQAENAALLSASGKTINVLKDSFRFAQSLRFDVGYDVTLAGIDWTAEAIYTKTLNDIVYRNLAYKLTNNTLGSTYSELSFDQRPMMERVTGGTPYDAVLLLDNTHQGYSYSLSIKGSKHFDFGLDLSASYTYSQSKSVNSGISSMASGNWNDNPIHGNSNRPELGFSAYNKPHTLMASVFYNRSYGAWNTQVGIVYNGTSGAPYSIVYNGDLNGDGSNANDLFFIPTDQQIDQMRFTANDKFTEADQRQNLKTWIAADPYLRKHRGEYFNRYADNEAFEHHFSFHLGQKYNFKVGKQMHALELTFDAMNIGNLFNKKWGRYTMIDGVANCYTPVSYKNGAFQFAHNADYDMRSYDDYFSRWRGQIGVKYTF